MNDFTSEIQKVAEAVGNLTAAIVQMVQKNESKKKTESGSKEDYKEYDGSEK